MEKIKKFFKEKYKILIPIMVVFVLLLTVYFLYREYKYDNYRNKKEYDVYQYFGGIKNEYTGIVTYNLDDIIVDIEAKDKKIEYDSTPVYFKEEKKIVFPYEMNMTFPLKEGSQFRVFKYSIYDKEENNHFIKSGMNRNEYSQFFLFDGKNLFFFPDEVTLLIDGKEYRKLSGMSYVKVVGGYTLEYYDYESDKAEVIEIENKSITVKNELINVNLSQRYLLSFGKKVLLLPPSNLTSLSN